MSKGIWTKHFSVDGKIYFYNAAQNRSVWVPPADSIIHEAINAKPPTYIELSGASSSYGKYSETLSEIEIQKAPVEVQYAPRPIVSHNPNVHDNFNEYHHYQQDNYSSRERIDQYIPSYDPQISDVHPEYFNNHERRPTEQQQDPRHNQYYGDSLRGEHVLERQDQHHHRQEQQQQQHLQLISVDDLMNHAANTKQRQQNSKRFRTAESSQETDSFGRVVTQGYLQQKSEFEARAGNRDDESGKWLVR